MQKLQELMYTADTNFIWILRIPLSQKIPIAPLNLNRHFNGWTRAIVTGGLCHEVPLCL